MTSHYFMNTNDGASSLIGPYGQGVYDALSNNPNLFMMLSGHWYGEAWSSETAGRGVGVPPVQVMMANYQGYVFPDDTDPATPAGTPTPNPAFIDFSSLPSFRAGNGATDAGFMRIMRFDTDTGRVDIETFIPPVVPVKNRTGTLVSTYSPGSGAGMSEFTASNLDFSFAGYVTLPSPTLFVANGFTGGISRVESDGSGLVELVSARPTLDVAVDSGDGKMYFAEVYSGEATADELRRSNLDGSGVELLESRGTINGVDLDIRAGKLYYAQPTAAGGGVYQANLDGTARTLVAAGAPTFVAFDPAGQQVYWTNRTQGFIRRANVDGTGQQTLLSGEAEPQDIELDVASGHMYWTDTTTREVLRANLNGSGRTVIVPASQFAAGTRPFGVALDLIEQKLYWTVADASPNRIERSNLDGTGIEVVTSGLTKRPIGLDLVRLP